MKKLILIFTVCFGFAAHAQNINFGLQAHYPLNNNGNDLSPVSNNLILDSSLTFSSFAANDHALEFNGTNRVEQVNPFDNSTFTSTAVSLWFRADSAVPVSVVTNNQFFLQAAYAGFGMGIDNITGKLYAYFSYSSSNSILSDSSYFDGTWHHFVAQNNGTTTKIYIDGVQTKTQVETHSTGNSPSLKKIYLGASNLNTRNFVGGLNDVRVYNRVLTPAEITILSTFPIATSLTTSTRQEDPVLNIYPNPTNGEITIATDENFHNSNFTVRNLLGQNIAEGILQTKQQTIHIDGPKGIYFVELITTNNKKEVRKIIKN